MIRILPTRCSEYRNLFLLNALSLCSSFNMRDQVSHPYKSSVIIMVLYILIFTFLDGSYPTEIYRPTYNRVSSFVYGILLPTRVNTEYIIVTPDPHWSP
jgi:hypothetical protein